MGKIDNLRTQCWDKSFYAFATSCIFERRAKAFKRKLKILTFLGLGIPAIVGFIFITFDPNSNWNKILVGIASIILLVQFIFSIWSLIYQWEDKLAYSLESISSNKRLSKNFKEIAENTHENFTTFQIQYKILQTEDDFRNDKDNHQLITEEEKRYGHRCALRQFQRKCTGCNEIPTSLNSTNCSICGNY